MGERVHAKFRDGSGHRQCSCTGLADGECTKKHESNFDPVHSFFRRGPSAGSSGRLSMGTDSIIFACAVSTCGIHQVLLVKKIK